MHSGLTSTGRAATERTCRCMAFARRGSKMPRLNDTKALRAEPFSDVEKTTRVRKIDNGYITSSSSYNQKTGDYKCSEKFSASAPKDEDDYAGSRAGVGNESLSDTKKYLGGDV
jgi:hypothetical protein